MAYVPVRNSLFQRFYVTNHKVSRLVRSTKASEEEASRGFVQERMDDKFDGKFDGHGTWKRVVYEDEDILRTKSGQHLCCILVLLQNIDLDVQDARGPQQNYDENHLLTYIHYGTSFYANEISSPPKCPSIGERVYQSGGLRI
jgi:hypothetical protein